MTVSIATFRQSYPEFTPVEYPDSFVTYYLTLAGLLLNTSFWGIGVVTPVSPPTTIYDVGTELFVAHHLVIERKAQQDAARGAVPGAVTGPVSSKSVGPISISYDNGAVIEPGAGHWNLSVYGLRFIKLARFRGAGPIQIGIGASPYNFLTSFGGAGAWPGPWPGLWAGGSGFGM